MAFPGSRTSFGPRPGGRWSSLVPRAGGPRRGPMARSAPSGAGPVRVPSSEASDSDACTPRGPPGVGPATFGPPASAVRSPCTAWSRSIFGEPCRYLVLGFVTHFPALARRRPRSLAYDRARGSCVPSSAINASTLARISSRISRNARASAPWVSGIVQRRGRARENHSGQDGWSAAPIETQTAAEPTICSVKPCGGCEGARTPISERAAPVPGFVARAGETPADTACQPGGLRLLKMASAITDRPAFPTQTNSTVRRAAIVRYLPRHAPPSPFFVRARHGEEPPRS